MCKKVIYLASMVNVLNLEVCKMYSIRKAWKVSLFRDFVLAVFLAVVGYMLTAMPAAYAGGGYALVFDGVDDYVDAENISQYQKLLQLTVEFWTWRTASEIHAEQFILGNSYYISYVQPITKNKLLSMDF